MGVEIAWSACGSCISRTESSIRNAAIRALTEMAGEVVSYSNFVNENALWASKDQVGT